MSYCVDDESAILVTVSEDLNLMIPASQEAPAQYIDVPLSQIKDATIENTESQSQFGTLMVKSLEVLIIWTLSPINKSIFINAAHYAATSIKISFTSPKDAEAVRNKVTRPKPHKNEELQIYQSEPIDVSQRILANKDHLETSHEYAVPADPIISIASQTNEIPNYDLSTPVELVPLRSTSYTPQPDIIKSFVQWPRKVTQDAHLQASTGDLISIANDAIEVHQFYGSSTSLRDTQQLLEDSLEPGIGSIAGWHQGAKIIENAPELQDSADRLENGGSELSERCTPVKQMPPEKLADIDSLYDATPRVEDKNRTQKQQPKSALHRRTSTQESAISPSLLTKNGVTNSITIRPAKTDEQIHKDLGSPAIESSIAAKAVIVKSTENRPAHTSMKLFTEDSSPSGHPNRSSPRSQNKKIGSSEHHRKLRTEILADGNSEIQNLYPKGTEQIQGSTSVTANLKVTRKVDIEFSPKPRLTNSPKRSDQWTKQTKPSSSGVSLRPPIKKNTKVRNSKIDDASWEVVLTDGEDSPEDSPVRKMPAKRKPKKSSKRHRNIDDNAYSVKKGLPKTATRAKKKTKSATQLEVQSTSTRAAPAMANKNHQGFTISNKSVEAQTNSSMMRPRPKVSRNQRNELSPKDLPGFKSKTYPRMMNGSLSRTLQTTIDDATAKTSGDLMQPIPLLPPRIEDHDKARNLKELDILGNQVCPSQTKNQVTPPVVEPNPILDEYSNFCQEESNELGTHIASPRGRADYRRKRIIEDSQPTDADCISNVPSSFSKVRSTPAPSSKKKTLSGGRSYVDDTASLDGVENGLFADATLIIENGAPDENLRTNDAYRAESKYTKSRIPLALQETSHSCDEKHKFVSKKPEVLISAQPEVPAAIKTKVPIAAKLESALSCVGSLHKQQFAPEAQMMKRPNAQPHKMHPASKTTYSTFEDQKQRSNQEIGVAVHSDHILKASSNSKPKPVMKLGTTQAPEEQMISGEANSQFPAKSDSHSKSGNQTLTSKKMHIVSESEESLQGDSLGGVYESKNELLKAAHKPINAMDFDEEHETGTIIQHRLESDQTARHLFDAEVANQKYKRGYDQIQQDSRKKMRITKESKLYRTPPRQITGHDKTPEKITPDINRKSNLISFSSNGPRNQGTIMNLKDRSHDIVPDQNPEVEGNSGLKTKIETDDRDCFGSPNKPLAEGSAHNSIRVLPTLDAGLIVAQRRNSSMFKETSHKPSSQSTRVDMNGSPMPFVHSRHFGLRAQGARSPFQILGSPSAAGNMIDDGEGFAMLDLRLNDVEPRLSKLATQSPYAPMVFEFNSSGNKKQRPSSPHEPSRALGELAPHTVHADGKMVNLQTANIVMPVKPPDPFLEVEPNQGHTTSFLNLLRKSTNASYKGADGKGERPAPTTILVDSDKTLVNGNSERRKAPRDTTPPGSSSSESSDSSSCPRSLSRPRHLSNSVEESLEESSWQEALQPHQRDTLDILCEVSHVRHYLLD